MRGEPGTPEFIASFNAAAATKVAPSSGTLLTLLFQFQDSAEFQFGISPRTRKDYIKQIKRIERDFGDFPIKALSDPRSRSVFSNGATGSPEPHCGRRTTPSILWRVSCRGHMGAG